MTPYLVSASTTNTKKVILFKLEIGEVFVNLLLVLFMIALNIFILASLLGLIKLYVKWPLLLNVANPNNLMNNV